MATTPVYGWPYQALSDAPNGALLGQNGFLAAEATVQARQTEIAALDVRIATLEARLPYRDRQTLAAPAATVTFSSIPATLRSLILRWTARSTDAAGSVGMSMRLNGDVGAQYDYEYIRGLGAVLTGAPAVAATFVDIGALVAAGSAAAIFSSGLVDFVGWDSPHPNNLCFSYMNNAQKLAGGHLAQFGGGDYVAAGPYTSITLLTTGNFVAGSDFQILGERV